MSRSLRSTRSAVRLLALALLGSLGFALTVAAGRDRQAATQANLFAADVERLAAAAAPGDEASIAAKIRVSALGRGVSLDFVDVASRDGRVCVRAEFRSEANWGPWHRTRLYEKRTSGQCVAGR